MAIIGLFTKVGIQKSISAANDVGFNVVPTKFGVSRDASTLDNTRVGPNSGQWYKEFISSRVVVNENTIKFVCTVPQDAISNPDIVREVYIYAEDNGDEYLLAFGQPSEDIQYDPAGTITLELQLSIVDIDLTQNYVFQNTKQTELDEHITAPDAHPEIVEAIRKQGIFVAGGMFAYDRVGQSFDEYCIFEGDKATATYQAVTFTARYSGDELNGEEITLDGQKTLDEIVADFNEAHPNFIIDHDGNPNSVLSAGSTTLDSGSYAMDERDLVYKDTDGVYKAAIADGTNKSKISGAAFRSERIVRGLGGFISIDTGYAIGTDLYLSSAEAGKITNVSTGIKVGHQVDVDYIFLGAFGGSSGGLSDSYDAIVGDGLGFKRYQTLQEAIDAVPNHGFILVEKMEFLKSRIRTFGKTVNIFFRGTNTGLRRFNGQNEIQRITFDNVPTEGTWRIEFRELYSNRVNQTNDLPFNASAALIESELNNLPGHNGVVVQGDYAVGFDLTFNDFIGLPLVSFADTGQNEIQRFDFSGIPDDGTVDFEFENVSGSNHAFNDTPEQLFSVLKPLPGINDIEIRGSLQNKYYEIEFKGVDSKKNHSPIYVENSNLNIGGSGGSGGVLVEINGVTTFPVAAKTISEGRYPSNNLKYGTSNVVITSTRTQEGLEVGPSKAIELDSNNCQFKGMGRIIDFNTGIDMSAYLNTRIEMEFDGVELPIDGKNQIIGREFNFDGSIGIEKDSFDPKPLYDPFINPVIDGVNTLYQLANGEPNHPNQFQLIKDQLVLRPDWYTVNGDIVEITNPAQIPVPGQDLLAWYTPDLLAFTPDIDYFPYFESHISNLSNHEYKIDLGNDYNRGSDRLEVYRNGVLMNLGTIIGNAYSRYQEFSQNEIGLSLHAQSSDVFSVIFKSIRVLSKGTITDLVTNTLSVPDYDMGTNNLRIWRNGVLMNNSSNGNTIDQYTEVDKNTISLAEQSVIEDVFVFEVSEFSGTREEVTTTGQNITLTNSIASGRYLVYRNGILMNKEGLGDAIDRYSFVNNFVIQLMVPLEANEYLTIIVY